MHGLTKVDDTIHFKTSVTFEIFDKSGISNFAFHFFYNKKRFKIIDCHVQGTIRHCMSNIRG